MFPKFMSYLYLSYFSSIEKQTINPFPNPIEETICWVIWGKQNYGQNSMVKIIKLYVNQKNMITLREEKFYEFTSISLRTLINGNDF